jgi:hypothetical protein
VTDGGTELDAWISELGRRLERGELAGLGLVDVRGLKLRGEWAVRVMLADLRHHDTQPHDMADDPLIPARRAALIVDFRRLRAQIG